MEPHILQTATYNTVLGRTNKLSPSSQAQWGKMDAAQMMAHVTKILELSTSNEKRSQIFIGRLLGPSGKREIFSKGMPKNSATGPAFKITEPKDFQKEKERLHQCLEKIWQGGEAGLSKQPHPFFGKLTPSEWSRLHYLHVDHHLRQFGV
jgi:hypothetical protein